MKVVFSLGRTQYTGSKKNGINSESRTGSELTFAFEMIQKEDEIIVKEGNKVDLLDPNANNKFISATISNIIESKFGKQLELSVKGNQNLKL